MVTLRLAEKPYGGSPNSSNKFLEHLQSKGYYGFYPNEHWTPNVNLYETEASYVVCVDLAGVDKKKIDIEVNDGHLTIRGNREVPNCPPIQCENPNVGRIRVHLMEIDHGAFARDVELPNDVHRDAINATYDNGMLWIELPKKR